jgi:phosphatidylglycerophosphatase GEP4
MVQSLNFKAMYTFATTVIRRPNLMIPHLSVQTISDIDFVALKAYTNIRAIAFDKDHTLTAPYVNDIHPLVKDGLKLCIDTFGRTNVAILSNSAGTMDDIHYQNAIQIESSLGIPVIRHKTKKPGGIDEVMSHFSSTYTSSSNTNTSTVTHPSQVCMIGDRILTDIVFGNLYNMFTIHTAALPHVVNNYNNNNSNNNLPTTSTSTSSSSPPKDNWTAQLLRPLENQLLYRSTKQFGTKRSFFRNPIPHPAYDNMMTHRHSFMIVSSTTTTTSTKNVTTSTTSTTTDTEKITTK